MDGVLRNRPSTLILSPTGLVGTVFQEVAAVLLTGIVATRSFGPDRYTHRMKERVPRSITIGEFQRRSGRVRRVARRMGFIGRVSYRHVYNDSGGGQYELGPLPEQDQLTVSAEAFERDADPSEYSFGGDHCP